MFFNKLKEEMQNWVYVKLAKLEDKFMQRVADAIKAANQTPEKLIKKYKHTQWYDVSPLTTAILEDRFNLVRYGNLAIYRGKDTLYSCSDYVGDTLSKAKEKVEKQEKNWHKTSDEISKANSEYTAKLKQTLAEIKGIAEKNKFRLSQIGHSSDWDVILQKISKVEE